MATSLGVRLVCEPLRSSAFGAIGAGYSAVGTPTIAPIRMMILQNFSDASVVFSFDGVHDHIVMPFNTQMILDVMSNKSLSYEYFVPENATFYVKRLAGAPTAGAVYISTFYAI